MQGEDTGHAWFGEHWGAPICDDTPHIPTPVGASCIDCGGPIGEQDQGLATPVFWVEGAEVRFRHLDCFLDTVLPHGPECERCRGLERGQHREHCSYVTQGDLCDCMRGAYAAMIGLAPSSMPLSQAAEALGISDKAMLDTLDRWGIRRRSRAPHKPGGES